MSYTKEELQQLLQISCTCLVTAPKLKLTQHLGVRYLQLHTPPGAISHVDLQGCSFLRTFNSVADFNVREPNGSYKLNLADPAEAQVRDV